MLRSSALLATFGYALTLAAAGSAEAQSPIYGQESLVFQSQGGPAYRVATVVDGLEGPWSFTWLPNGDMLVTERPGRLRLVRDGQLVAEPITGVPEVRYLGQGGLLDVVLHPEFETNRLVYLSFSKPNADGSQGTTAVVRGEFDGTALNNVEEIFEAQAWSETGGHYGSRMVFDRDGYLFITVGDRQAEASAEVDLRNHPAQDLASHQGKVIRLNDDGTVPADNPFVNTPGALPEIYTRGHRSPQGLAMHPVTGEIWQTEHGPQGGDELNLIQPGKNYGWPVIGYGRSYGGADLHEGTADAEMEQPIQFWTPVIAPSGLMIYNGDRFPEWQNSVFVGGLTGHQLVRLPLVGDDGHQIGRFDRPHLLMGYARLRDVRQGPDGYIYLAIDDRYNGGLTPIVRLEPVDPPGV